MKHITVTPPEDDEIIIAGDVSAVEPESEPEPKPAPEPEPVPEPAPEPQAKTQPEPARKKDEYRETTLEDLSSTPMPLAQKIVIIAAVVCILGALLYYFTVMR